LAVSYRPGGVGATIYTNVKDYVGTAQRSAAVATSD